MPSRSILFLYPTLAVGGAERQLALLAPRLQERGFRPVVATLRQRGHYFHEVAAAGVPTVHVGMRGRTDPRALVHAYRLWRLKPSLVFTQGVNAQVLGQAIAYRAGAVHVTAEHAGSGFVRGAHRTLLAQVVARTVDHVVCVSASQVPDLRGLGYREPAIHVIPNGIPDVEPTRPAAEIRRGLGLGEEDFVALLVANLRAEKRVDVFVESIAQATRTDPRIRGVVVGGGPELELARSQARSAHGAVLVLGERSDVPDLMGCADAVCLSSDLEAVPLTLLEAMAARKPVIATAVGGVPEIVTEGETGLLVPPGDPAAFAEATLALAADPDLGRRMGEKARVRFESKYTVELMTDRYVALFSALGRPERTEAG